MNIALLVGVNHYQMPGNDLQGCVNDVNNMRSLLLSLGFSVMRIKTMIDKQATKKHIMDAMVKMVRGAKAKDHLVFLFSGHGSQVPDTNGDEADRMDEVICPHDFSWSNYIKDDDWSFLADLNSRATLDVLFDSCHSGTGLRAMGDSVAKFIPYPDSILPLPSLKINRTFDLNKMLSSAQSITNVALFSGCRDNQTSADACINSMHQGAMTWSFIKSLREDFLATRSELISSMQEKLTANQYDQVPQLECSEAMRDQRIFR